MCEQEVQFPSSLYDIAAAMIDRLDPSAALVVKVASVVGDVFTADTLLQLHVLPEEVQICYSISYTEHDFL